MSLDTIFFFEPSLLHLLTLAPLEPPSVRSTTAIAGSIQDLVTQGFAWVASDMTHTRSWVHPAESCAWTKRDEMEIEMEYRGRKAKPTQHHSPKMSISKWKRLDHLPTMSCLTTPWNNFHRDCQGSRTTAWFNAKTAPAIPLAGPTMWISCSLVWYKMNANIEKLTYYIVSWAIRVILTILSESVLMMHPSMCHLSRQGITDLGLNNHPFLPQVPRHAWHLTASFVKLSQEPVSVSIARPSQSTCTALPCHRKLSINLDWFGLIKVFHSIHL